LISGAARSFPVTSMNRPCPASGISLRLAGGGTGISRPEESDTGTDGETIGVGSAGTGAAAVAAACFARALVLPLWALSFSVSSADAASAAEAMFVPSGISTYSRLTQRKALGGGAILSQPCSSSPRGSTGSPSSKVSTTL